MISLGYASIRGDGIIVSSLLIIIWSSLYRSRYFIVYNKVGDLSFIIGLVMSYCE